MKSARWDSCPKAGMRLSHRRRYTVRTRGCRAGGTLCRQAVLKENCAHAEPRRGTTNTADTLGLLLRDLDRYPMPNYDEQVALAKRVSAGDEEAEEADGRRQPAARPALGAAGTRTAASRWWTSSRRAPSACSAPSRSSTGSAGSSSRPTRRGGSARRSSARSQQHGRTIRIPLEVGELLQRLEATTAELTSQLGRRPTDEEIEAATGMTRAERGNLTGLAGVDREPRPARARLTRRRCSATSSPRSTTTGSNDVENRDDGRPAARRARQARRPPAAGARDALRPRRLDAAVAPGDGRPPRDRRAPRAPRRGRGALEACARTATSSRSTSPPEQRARAEGHGRELAARRRLAAMELTEALRTTGAVRSFDPRPRRPRHRLRPARDRAVRAERWEPPGVARRRRGGPRQEGRRCATATSRLVRVRRPGTGGSRPVRAGHRPRRGGRGDARRARRRAAAGGDGFAEHLDEVPVLLAVSRDLRRLAALDRDEDGVHVRRRRLGLPVLLVDPARRARRRPRRRARRRWCDDASAEARALLALGADHVAVAGVLASAARVEQPTRLRARTGRGVRDDRRPRRPRAHPRAVEERAARSSGSARGRRERARRVSGCRTRGRPRAGRRGPRRARARGAAVAGVVHERAADCREVHADLVGPPGLQSQLEQRARRVVSALDHSVRRCAPRARRRAPPSSWACAASGRSARR